MHLSQKGFTLVELLVVISIIGLLSSIVLTSVNSARAKARDARRIADFKQIQLALEFFYDSQGRYPMSPGAPTWDGHWQYFSNCLETGADCGFIVSGYTSAISKVPQDPRDDPATLSDADPTYYYGYPGACGTGQVHRLAAYLETDNNALRSDMDGSFYNGNGGCNDAIAPYGYCVGVGTCSGW